MSKRLAECQRVVGYHFANSTLLEIALTHSSVRTPDRECNERLEFLGDSVLGLAITEELYKRLPDQQEGELTRIKSAVVSRGALYRVSMRLGLPRFVEVAKGVVRREELPVSLTANLVESIIGAIYLDAGFFPAREFILRHLGPEVEDVMNDRVAKNYKSLLQHEAQQALGVTPVYRTLEEEGPDHRKAFTVAAIMRGTEYGRATGINKKEAEQEAARHALEALTHRGRGRRRRTDSRDGGRGDGGRGDGGRGDGGRGEGRGDPRGGRSRDVGRDVAPHGRGESRDPARPATDDDAWRAWAERDAAAAPRSPEPAAPSGPYVVGPEPEEAYLDESERGTGRGSRPVTSGPASDPRPAIAASSEAGNASSEGGDVGPEGDAGDEGAPRTGRRRRGRRGGRRRRTGDDAPAPASAAGGETPEGSAPAGIPPEADAIDDMPVGEPGARGAIAPEADSLDQAPRAPRARADEPVDAGAPPRERAPRARGARGGRSAGGRGRGRTRDEAPRDVEAPRSDAPRSDAPRSDAPRSDSPRSDAPRADAPAHREPAPPRERAPRERAPAGEREVTPRAPRERAPRASAPREQAPREAAPREQAAPRPAAPKPESKPQPAAPRSTGPGFGQGVLGGGAPAAPAPVEREVTRVGGVVPVKKAPQAPGTKPSGGFGTGL